MNFSTNLKMKPEKMEFPASAIISGLPDVILSTEEDTVTPETSGCLGERLLALCAAQAAGMPELLVDNQEILVEDNLATANTHATAAAGCHQLEKWSE